jgi:hypothetical protein
LGYAAALCFLTAKMHSILPLFRLKRNINGVFIHQQKEMAQDDVPAVVTH